MSGSEKPFACTMAGCNMSFVNEDHLTVHKKKHDMMLNLGINNKNNFFIADQTPTPTRFIRNCEEVGLFQDLHNDNPFEETFRRAVEAGKSGVLSVPEAHENDDTLHTPNIFPHMPEVCTPNVTASLNKPDKSVALNTLVEKSEKEINIETVKTIVEDDDKTDVINVSPKTSVIQTALDTNLLPSTSVIENSCTDKSKNNLPMNAAEMQLLLKTQDGKVLRFVASVAENEENPIALLPKQSSPKVINLINNKLSGSVTKIQNQKLSAAKMKLKQTLTKNGTIISSSETQSNQSSLDKSSKQRSKNGVDPLKKQAILERNRASSMRARAKRRAWIEELQQSLKTANETNANLQAQLKSLHNQIEKLKALLLAHKDCPITKAMEEGNGIVVSTKIVPIKPNQTKLVSIAAEPGKPVKRSNTQVSIVPNKKSIILPTVMSPIVLPTSDSTPNTITLHAAEAIKPIPTINIVSPLVANSQNGKTIFSFLPPKPGDVSVLQQGNRIVVNKNFNKNGGSEILGT